MSTYEELKRKYPLEYLFLPRGIEYFDGREGENCVLNVS
jgi:hypothetical protein